jgi:hypothetical protein
MAKGGHKLDPVPTRAAVDSLQPRTKSARAAKRRRRNAILMGEALDLAKTYDISISKGNTVVDVLQTLLDRLMDKWRFVCKKVDMLEEDQWLVSRTDEMGNTLVEPNVWIQYEGVLRSELMDLSIRMGHLGVDERRVRVEEAKIELLGRAVLAAAHAIGLPVEQQRALGAALRDELVKLESPEGAENPAVRQNGPGRANDKHPVIEARAQEAS